MDTFEITPRQGADRDLVFGATVKITHQGTLTDYTLTEYSGAKAGTYYRANVPYGVYDIYVDGTKIKDNHPFGIKRPYDFIETLDPDGNNEVDGDYIKELSVPFNALTQAAQDMVSSGGSVTNNPDDVYLATNASSQISLKDTYQKRWDGDSGETGIKEVGIWEHVLNNNIVNVKDYGADSTGASDSTTAINDAITAAQSASGVVFFPAGTYLIASKISCPHEVVLRGDSSYSSVIKSTTSSGFIEYGGSTKKYYGGISNLGFDCNNVAAIGLHIRNVVSGKFSNLRIYTQNVTSGIGLYLTGSCYFDNFTNVWISGGASIASGSIGLYLDESYESSMPNANNFKSLNVEYYDIGVKLNGVINNSWVGTTHIVLAATKAVDVVASHQNSGIFYLESTALGIEIDSASKRNSFNAVFDTVTTEYIDAGERNKIYRVGISADGDTGENLLRNPSLKWLAAGYPDYWTLSGLGQYDTYEGGGFGKYCARLRMAAAGASVLSQTVDMNALYVPARPVNFFFYAKSDAATVPVNMYLQAYFYDSSGSQVGTMKASWSTVSNSWTRYQLDSTEATTGVYDSTVAYAKAEFYIKNNDTAQHMFYLSNFCFTMGENIPPAIKPEPFGLANASPISGRYSYGDIVFNGQPASSESAGWICTRPGHIAPTWAASTSYSVGERIKPATYSGYYYEATVAGTSSGSEPTWPTTIGSTVTDGGVTWKCMGDVAVFKGFGTIV